uniref:Uncharacterized protein n=1 Tax=Setaria digitata TaxID=48799 RepID=A0A915PZB4_9BILA
MYKDDENKNTVGAEASPRHMVLRPKILARRVVRKISSATVSSTESTALDSKSCSIEKVGFGDDILDEASRMEAIFGCAALGELLQRAQPLPITEQAPAFCDNQLCMRFGDEEDVSDRVRMIGVALAERALKALRTVSENEPRFQFTFPKEAAKVNLNSADDSASVSQSLSGSHPRKKTGGRKASMCAHITQHVKQKEFRIDQGRHNAVKRKKKTEAQDFPSTSAGYGNVRESDAAAGEHLSFREKQLVDQVMLLCSQFIRTIDYADSSWYSKLKMAVFFRLKQLMENTRDAISKRRELRERNEELRKMRQRFIEQSRTTQPECASAYEEVLPGPSTEWVLRDNNSSDFVQTE